MRNRARELVRSGVYRYRFDAVIINEAQDLTPVDEAEEEAHIYRRLLFVGITRAMRALLVAYPWKQPSAFVAEFDPALWDGEWAGAQADRPGYRNFAK